MSQSPHHGSPSRAQSQVIPGSNRPDSPSGGPISRQEATVRLGSPIPSSAMPTAAGSPPALSFLQGANVNFGTPPRFGTPSRFDTPQRFGTPPRGSTPMQIDFSHNPSRAASIYGSFDSRQPHRENPEIVKKHLVTEDDTASNRRGRNRFEDDEFSSLQLQGGDVTRGIYRYVEEAESSSIRRGRSHSFHVSRPEPEDAALDIHKIKVPGGFRRNYLRARAGISPTGAPEGAREPRWLADNFIEFLSLYGHFAGEELGEDDEDDTEAWASDESPTRDPEEGGMRRRMPSYHGDDEDPEETTGLISSAKKGRRRSKSITQGTAGSGKAILLLLKSFVGTG